MRNLSKPLEISILLYPGVQMSAVLGITDLFFFADRLSRERLKLDAAVLRVSHVNADEVTRIGRRVYDTMPDTEGSPAFVVIPPCLKRPGSAGFDSLLIDWLVDLHSTGTKLASVCGGAFVIAQTGLVKSGVVTTHYSLVAELSERFPKLKIDADQIMIDNGDVITAGGLLAWTDLGLHLVERTLGPIAMLETAKFMLIDPPGREQRYYQVFSPSMLHGDDAVLKTQQWLAALSAPAVSTTDMAAQANLEERTFLRRFRKATGLKPQEYCQHLRIAKARQFLSERRLPIEKIAREVGYDDSGSFRKVFFKLTGLTPLNYRKRFGLG